MKTMSLHLLRAAFALAVIAPLTGCGKSTSAVRPTTPAGGELTRENADQMAQRSASMVLAGGALSNTNAVVFASFAGGTAARQHARPAAVGTVTTDSSSYSYVLHAYDATGQEIDWTVPGHAPVARVATQWLFHVESTSDSLSFRWHTTGAYDYSGFEAAATRWVVSGAQDDDWAMDMLAPPYHWIWHYVGHSQATGVTWEKSLTPSYPVAGRITLHWSGTWDHTDGANHSAGAAAADCTITFDGTRYASLVVGTYHYRLDLVTGEIELLPAA